MPWYIIYIYIYIIACSETNVLCSDCTSGSSCTECVRDAEMIGGECKCRGGYEQDGHLCREEDDEDEYDKLNTIVVIVSLILLFCAALILVICIYCCKVYIYIHIIKSLLEKVR